MLKKLILSQLRLIDHCAQYKANILSISFHLQKDSDNKTLVGSFMGCDKKIV
jgi:hypothetical protein